MPKKLFCLSLMLIVLLLTLPGPAYADSMGLIFRGVVKTLGAVFEIPRAMLEDSTRMIFPVGILTGAVSGTFRTLGSALDGAYDMARGAAPYAKYLIFLTRLPGL